MNYSVSCSDEDCVPHVLEEALGVGGSPQKPENRNELCPWRSKHLSKSQIGNET